MLKEQGLQWTKDFDEAANEVHALYRLREWGHV
jgi:hypothetical protein